MFGNLAKPDQLLEIHDSARAGMKVVMRKAMETGDAPEVVARTVLIAATESVPRRRYAAGKMARRVSILRRFVPESAYPGRDLTSLAPGMKLMRRSDFMETSTRWSAMRLSSICDVGAPAQFT